MGAEPYEYVLDYETDIAAALHKLRERVFESGEFRGSERSPVDSRKALELAGESGTASILDILCISEQPMWCAASPFSDEELDAYFDTPQPTAEMALNCEELWEDIDRGTARYVVCYESGAPTKIVFLGYSFD